MKNKVFFNKNKKIKVMLIKIKLLLIQPCVI